MDFKSGDVVELKSGGPSMTVTSVDGDKVSVVWFEDKLDGLWGGVRVDSFLAATLELEVDTTYEAGG